jgi:predicted RND superfamily exporter protein
MADVNEVSEHVEVSANKLQILIAQSQESKEKYVKQMAHLESQLKAQDEKIKLYESAIQRLKLVKNVQQSRNGEGSKRILEELNKAKKFDEWFSENKDKLVEDLYNKQFKTEVDDLKHKLEHLF